MTRLTGLFVLASALAALSTTIALAEEPAAPAAQSAQASADPASNANTSVAQSSGKYPPPPGFKTKVRKGETVYCRSRAPIGTRIKNEECFNQAEIEEVERAMSISKEDTQQRGRMCNKGFMCTGGG